MGRKPLPEATARGGRPDSSQPGLLSLGTSWGQAPAQRAQGGPGVRPDQERGFRAPRRVPFPRLLVPCEAPALRPPGQPPERCVLARGSQQWRRQREEGPGPSADPSPGLAQRPGAAAVSSGLACRSWHAVAQLATDLRSQPGRGIVFKSTRRRLSGTLKRPKARLPPPALLPS